MKIDWVAYEEGRYAASQYSGDVSREKNPYPQESDKWLSWNRGWRGTPGNGGGRMSKNTIVVMVAFTITIILVLIQAWLSRLLGIDFNLQGMILYFVILISLKGDKP